MIKLFDQPKEKNILNNLQVFKNEQFGEIRISLQDNEPWMCLSDLCSVLELTTPSKVKERLNQKGVSSIPTLTNGGTQNLIYINEGNLYKVIFQSRKPEAEKFTDWVTTEVLPSIRKHGMYSKDELLDNPDLLLDVVNKYKNEIEEKKLLQAQIEKDRPRVIFAEALEISDNSILVGDLAKILRQNNMQIGQNRIFEDLRKDGYLISRKGESYNMPIQRSIDMGLLEIKVRTINNPDGSVRTAKTPKITAKGQIYFVNRYKKEAV
jgi:anti-repressor protein